LLVELLGFFIAIFTSQKNGFRKIIELEGIGRIGNLNKCFNYET